MKKVGEIIFKNLPVEVITANSIRPVYIKKGDKIPKKYDNLYFDFVDGYLCDLQDNSKVVLNAKMAGTARTISIGGNKLQSLAYSKNPADRTKVIKIKKTLQEYFLTNMQTIKITTYPINIELKFYINMTMQVLDRDNLAIFYEKAFYDCIQTHIRDSERQIIQNPKGFIPNDDIAHVNGGCSKVFFTEQSPYLVVNFYEYANGEYDKDKSNINLDVTLINKIEKLSTQFANTSLFSTVHKSDIYDQATKEMKEEHFEFWKREYESYFKVLSNEFL